MRGNNKTSARNAEAGVSLVELMIALSLLASFVMATGMTLIHGFTQREDSFAHYQRMSELRGMAATIQNIANMQPDLPNGEGIGALYMSYHDEDIDIDSVANVHVVCFANESTVPDILGGPQDLNFDGDAQDNLANESNGTDMKIVPMSLTMTFGDSGAQETLTIHRLITVTSNE